MSGTCESRGNKVLALSSPDVLIRVQRPGAPHVAEFGSWTLRETYRPDCALRDGEPCGLYGMRLECEVGGEDPGSVYIAGQFLARDVDKMWVYVTGHPLSRRGTDWFLSPMTPPAGWTSNAKEIIPEDDWMIITEGVVWGSSVREMPTLPLRSVVSALDSYQSDELLSELVEIHYSALIEGSLPLLGKALEAAVAMLPGKDRHEKQSKLPAAVRDAQTYSITEIMETANTRRDIRHLVQRGGRGIAHPGLGDDERRRFVHDADLLVRYAVTKSLGIESALLC